MYSGKLIVITGPMFSEKSTTLLSKLRRAKRSGKRVTAFKPVIDDRYSSHEVVTHDGVKFPAHAINSSQAIKEFVPSFGYGDVIGLDEVQFFDDGIVDVVMEFVNNGAEVYAAGLPTDFRGEPFLITAKLMALADSVISLTSVCRICGEDAVMTQRLINGEPAHYNDPIVLVGGEESYEARCRFHHEVRRD